MDIWISLPGCDSEGRTGCGDAVDMVDNVQVESSGSKGCGVSPCRLGIDVSVVASFPMMDKSEMTRTYIEYWILAFDLHLDVLSFEVDDEVFGLIFRLDRDDYLCFL